jgi:amino acid adenylation domain-containing protein
MTNQAVVDIYPLTPMQQGMLFHSIAGPWGESMYVGQTTCLVEGNLDIDALKSAWQHAIDRHEILRTSFLWEGLSAPMQVVQRTAQMPTEIADWQDADTETQRHRLQEYVAADRRRGLDLTTAPVMRLAIFRESSKRYRLVRTHHHILLDGWSDQLIVKEVFETYEALVSGRQPRPQPATPFKDYIAWLSKQNLAEAETFWRKHLEAIEGPTPLPFALPRPQAHEMPASLVRRRVRVSPAVTASLKRLVQTQRITMNTIVQGAWAIFLSRCTGHRNVLFGATVSGRPAALPGVESMLGLFINTLPVRVSVDPSAPLLAWLSALQEEQLQAREFDYTPLVQLQTWTQVPPGQPLFESLLVFENYPIQVGQPEIALHDKAIAVSDRSYDQSINYPLALTAAWRSELGIQVALDPHRIDPAFADRIASHLEAVLAGMAANPDNLLNDLPLVTEASREQVLAFASGPKTPIRLLSIPEAFALQVRRTPDATAILSDDGHALTYANLDSRANEVAQRLRNSGIQPENPVAVFLDRSPELLIAMLGVLKAGGVYVPIDPASPFERMHHILSDSRAPVILTVTQLVPRIGAGQFQQVVCLDLPPSDVSPGGAAEVRIEPDNLAYFIYTSGSTGTPKGVMCTHGSLVAMVDSLRGMFSVSTGTLVAQIASMAFDASVSEIFTAMLAGATICLCPRQVSRSTEALVAWLSEHCVSFAAMPPSVMAAMPDHELRSLQTMIAAGEHCPAQVAERWSTGRQFFNGYGPTECTVAASVGELLPTSEEPHMGTPLANYHLFVLDSGLQLASLGVVGELYIGGVGVCRGYVASPDMTAERFVPDPWSGTPGARLYKTGDLVFYRSDGKLQFVGRVDRQVKRRGHRIELGEIESVLRAHPQVRAAAVIATDEESATRRLIGYFVPVEKGCISARELRDFVSTRLPEYMFPSAYVELAAMPLAPSGKLDYSALPEPKDAVTPSHPRMREAWAGIREILAGIWTDVLRSEPTAPDDNFFEMGGHSLLATQLISRVRGAFDVDLKLESLFNHPCFGGFAAHVEQEFAQCGRSSLMRIERTPRNGRVPLSFAQRRLWFLHRLEPTSAAYNCATGLRVPGPLDRNVLKATFGEIIRRHEVLRTSFPSEDGEPWQEIAPPSEVALRVVDLSASQDREALATQLASREAELPFDLENDPPVRLSVLVLEPNDHVLFITMHHIVCDGWSLNVLVREFVEIYGALSRCESISLPEPEIQYADYALWQRAEEESSAWEEKLAYWCRQLGGSLPSTNLPGSRPAADGVVGRRMFVIDAETAKALKDLSRDEHATLFMVMLAAFKTLLFRMTGEDDIIIGTDNAGRNRAELEWLVGFFVNMLVLRTNLAGDPTFRDLIRRVRRTTLDAYAHQDVPYDRIVEALRPDRVGGHSPMFRIMFGQQNVPVEQLRVNDRAIERFGKSEEEHSRFDVSIWVNDRPGQLTVSWHCRPSVADASLIQDLQKRYESILQLVAATPDTRLSNIRVTTAEEERLKQGESRRIRDRNLERLRALTAGRVGSNA